jgi:hypothetical protein
MGVLGLAEPRWCLFYAKTIHLPHVDITKVVEVEESVLLLFWPCSVSSC